MASEPIDKTRIRWALEDLEDFQSIDLARENTLLPNDKLERFKFASKFVSEVILETVLITVDPSGELYEKILRSIQEVGQDKIAEVRQVLNFSIEKLNEINEVGVTTISEIVEKLQVVEDFFVYIDPSDE